MCNDDHISALFILGGITAFTTGGSTGIGVVIARGFLKQGATVIVNAIDVKRCA